MSVNNSNYTILQTAVENIIIYGKKRNILKKEEYRWNPAAN